MIHKTSFSKREIKKFSREVKYAEVAMVDTPEFIDWSEQSISFDRTDHLKAVPRPGHVALVLEAQIGGYNMSKVFMDGGSGLNLLFVNTMRAMGLTVDMLRESDTGFHGIIPTRPAYSLGKTSLDVVFGTPNNFRKEKIEFEVVDWESQYHAILGRPAFAKFMAVPHYAYLKLKMPGNNGTPITVHGSFARSDTCDREFQKIASKFGAKEELNAIDAAIDHTQPPADNRNEGALIEFLRERWEIFAWEPSDMPGIPRELTEHALNVDPTAKPVQQSMRRFSEPKRRAIGEEVNRLRKAGFIRELKESEWVANPVMVPKKDTTALRMCIDYTGLNKHCPKDHFPLPRIDQIVDSTAGCDRLSFLDAYSGYNQIKLKKEDQELTAFITPHGVFCYNVMTFGLKNAGATYQRCMQACLGEQIGRNIEVYIDDIVVKTKHTATLVDDLRETFDNLDRGIEANPLKIKAILDMEPPKNLHQVQQLAGRLAALSRFIAKLGEKALPFYNLMKKSEKFEWTKEAQESFDNLKKILSTSPVLVTPREKETLLMYIAATAQVFSSVLVVEREEAGRVHGVQRPVYYLSEVLTPARQRFHVGAGISGVAPHYIPPPSTFNVLLGSSWFHVGACGVAPHYIPPPSTFNVLLGSSWFDKPWFQKLPSSYLPLGFPTNVLAFKAMDRSWITDGTKKFTTKYMAGVRDFIKFAREHLDNTDEPILCPCKDCLNLIRQDIKTVEDHCNCSGMSMTYTRWTRHGEGFSDDEGRDRNDDGAYDSDNDEEEDNGDCYVDDSSSMIDELQKSGNKGPDLPNLYANLIESAKKELYEGCTSFTRLSFIIKLLHVKSYSRITNRGFDLLLQLLRTALPDVDFPKSYADAKSVLSDVGLGYETIHACKFDCSLFWGDHKDDTHCHVCGLSRYRDPTGKKKIPHKVLRYFPIIKRLQRLFVKKEMSTHTRWHKEKRVVEPNVLRHPADGEAWKHFDGRFDWFAKDPRNIRLGFATDGFSPFGSMSNPYSMWPVFVIPYNFPPWMCMDQSNYMMALLIPGKYSPGKDFHVFMQPLIKDMMQLWSGVETFDACTEEYFPLHAAFLWSIHDYPGYATMSGRSTRGFHACVHCDENPCAESLKNKIGYIGHRRFLDKNHPYRKSRLFNGKAETRDPPRKYTPKEVAGKVERVKDFEHGKNPISRKRKRATVPGEPTWHLKVSLHHLPYWPELKIAHNLDVMHIEKNICDNIVGTLLELEGRNKDTVSARIDLKKFKIWKKYWLKKIVKDDDDAAVTYAKPPAPWTLSKEQKRHLCRYLANTRFPDGYCANWGRCVNIDGCKVTGMKTHDCHILLQRVLPAGLKGIASKEMYVAIAELGRFFRELCAKTLKVDVLNRLKVEIVVILCKLEKLFPPAFFDVMVHLAIHLPDEALLRGPVHYGWMYPVERRLGYLKSTVRNKARPEGSIAEGYIVDECLIFCSRFFKDGTETRFNKDDRNQDIRRKPDPDEMEVFSVGAKGLGKSILKHFDKEFDKMVWYVLNNCDDVERYINEFRQELGGRGVRDIEETVQREFAGWFANHVRQLDNASEDLKSLAAGPDRRVVVYAGCNVKGARFRTLTRDKDLKTQNSGVATKGSFGDADETEYYGVLQEVLELQYGTNKHGDRSVYLFRCDWFDLAGRGSKIKDDGYFKSVNTSILWFKNSPFILASQAETCFYLEDTKFGDPWKVVQKFSHRHVYDVPELEDGNDDAFVRNEDAYQEDEGSVDHTFHDVVDLDEEAEVEAEEDDHRAAEVVRIHDARTIRELENEEDSPNVDMDMSEDELENQEDSLILEENIHDDEGKNSEEDSDVD
ncbi:hypothetical protein QYE76_055999 [Lolium multiflorum]|uniref:Uncharacterized protein n=1 Tax=Lolium multiflorum TaxID=4521 RepID=A0AAD8WQ02_LOLMU|nr:hypothetical protein QYE76_055999 [Lolium multiflorum]